MSTYTDSSDIVFLNDKNIVHDINTDISNAIASQTLVSALSNTIADTYVSANDAKMTAASAVNLTATSANVSSLTANILSVNNGITANALDIIGNAGTVNVANVNATSQISVENNTFYAKDDNGKVYAKNLTANTLSIADNINVNGNVVADSTGLTATALSTQNINVSNSITAHTIATDIINATDGGVLGDITADNIVATQTIYAVTAISVNNSLTANSSGINTPGLTATTISANNEKINNDLLIGNRIILGDTSDFNINKGNDRININTTGAADPHLYINDKKFTEYFANYLSDGYIETIDTHVSNGISGLRFIWNQDAPSSVGAFTENSKRMTFIPLSALGGIYDQAGDIIKVIKNEANSFKISADASAISNAISAALSSAFELSDVKEAIANKVLLQEGTGPIQQLTSLNIKTLGADEYSALNPQNDTIYVLTGNNMELFGNKIVGVGDPTENTDAANKQYVDGAINRLTIQNDGTAKKIILKAGSTQLAEFSTTDFIKDGFLQSVTIADNPAGKKSLKFVWNTDAGITTNYVLLTDIAKPYAGDGTYITITDDPTAPSQIISLNTDAVSTNIKVAMYDEFESKITNNTTGTVYTKTQVNSISSSLSNTVANDYATKADYVSNDALSGPTGILTNYCTIAYLNDPYSGAFNSYYTKPEIQGLSGNLTTNAASQIATALTNYYTKTQLIGDAGLVYTKDQLTADGTGIFYTRDQLLGNGSYNPALTSVYASLAAVNARINTVKAGITTNNIGTISSSDPDLALADVADKLNDVISAVEQIKSVLSGLNIITSTT